MSITPLAPSLFAWGRVTWVKSQWKLRAYPGHFSVEINTHIFNRLRALHRMRAVERSGEYRASENHSGACSEDASAKPTAHNPRKQRKNPAAAGWGERFREGKWRAEADETENYVYSIALHAPLK